MAKTGSFIHQATTLSDIASVGTSFDAAKKHAVRLRDRPSAYAVGANLSAIYVEVDTIAGGAAKLSIQVSTDSAGDKIIVPSTEATMGVGVTTGTKGAAVYDLSIAYAASSDQIYVFYKTDAGTVTVKSVSISWSE